MKKYNEKQQKTSASGNPLNLILGGVFALLLVWGLFKINPYPAATPAATPIPAAAQVQAVPATPAAVPAEEPAIGETPEQPEESAAPAVEKTVYRIPEGQTAPAPNPAAFGCVPVESAAQMEEVYQRAVEYGLLEADEAVAFRSDADFNRGSYYQDIMYYLDETLLVACWKELVGGATLTMCEIKIGDGSQMRMNIWGDINNENDNNYLSQAIAGLNCVVAMNTDKCKARGDGILICDRQIYKYNENPYAGNLKRYNCLDNCLVTGDGDFLFTYRLEEKTLEEMQQFVADNNVIFSMSFGPCLIDEGQMRTGYFPGDENYIEYAFGENEKPYSRAGIGQLGTRHYVYCSLNHSDEMAANWTMRDFAENMYARGYFRNFYALDGGQTAELIINDTIYNHIDFGAERLTSNWLYFCSALPEGAAS